MASICEEMEYSWDLIGGSLEGKWIKNRGKVCSGEIGMLLNDCGNGEEREAIMTGGIVLFCLFPS